jgi:type II secretion system protein J
MMPRRPSPLRCRRGFTLLELLIATAVGAVVLLASLTTFFGALRLHNTTHERIDRDLTLQRALGIVRRDLAGLMLPGGVLSGQLQTTTFSSTMQDAVGERVSPDLHTNTGKVDGWNPFSEVQMVAYFLAPATGSAIGKNLVRVVTRNLLPVQQDTPTEEQTLLAGVETATLEYLDGGEWTDAWDSETTSTLPTAIKFRLMLAHDGRAQDVPGPVELVVPIMVTTRTSLAIAAEAAAAELP